MWKFNWVNEPGERPTDFKENFDVWKWKISIAVFVEMCTVMEHPFYQYYYPFKK